MPTLKFVVNEIFSLSFSFKMLHLGIFLKHFIRLFQGVRLCVLGLIPSVVMLNFGSSRAIDFAGGLCYHYASVLETNMKDVVFL